jgi:hypothetical protein
LNEEPGLSDGQAASRLAFFLLARHLIPLGLVAVPTRLGCERTLEVFGEPLFDLLLGLREMAAAALT